MSTLTPLRWQLWAACKGIDDRSIFFPTRGASVAAAKKICAGCPVRVACLDEALTDRRLDGIWGGTSYRQRRRIWAARPSQTTPPTVAQPQEAQCA